MLRDADASVFQNWAVLETRGWFLIVETIQNLKQKKKKAKAISKS